MVLRRFDTSTWNNISDQIGSFQFSRHGFVLSLHISTIGGKICVSISPCFTENRKVEWDGLGTAILLTPIVYADGDNVKFVLVNNILFIKNISAIGSPIYALEDLTFSTDPADLDLEHVCAASIVPQPYYGVITKYGLLSGFDGTTSYHRFVIYKYKDANMFVTVNLDYTCWLAKRIEVIDTSIVSERVIPITSKLGCWKDVDHHILLCHDGTHSMALTFAESRDPPNPVHAIVVKNSNTGLTFNVRLSKSSKFVPHCVTVGDEPNTTKLLDLSTFRQSNLRLVLTKDFVGISSFCMPEVSVQLFGRLYYNAKRALFFEFADEDKTIEITGSEIKMTGGFTLLFNRILIRKNMRYNMYSVAGSYFISGTDPKCFHSIVTTVESPTQGRTVKPASREQFDDDC